MGGYKKSKKITYLLVSLLLSISLIPTISSTGTYLKDSKIVANYYKNNMNVFSEINIIITPPEFYSAAEKLKKFHDNEGVSTRIVNTTWINNNYQKAPNPQYLGYAKGFLPKIFIRNYKFTFAKKIISFLRDSDRHPNLEYVILFGTGKLIPPSYYVYTPLRCKNKIFGKNLMPDFYNNRIATDFFYISPDYDLTPDFKVGRLPVSNIDEAEHVVQKIIDWAKTADINWFKNIYVGGGQPDLPEEMDLHGCYAGEMISVDAINRGYFNGMNITKLFWTEGMFNRETIIDVFNEGNAGIIYMMAHGYIDKWYTYQESNPFVKADDLLSLPVNTKVPIVVSVACMSGAFDIELSHKYNVNKEAKSFGEAVLLSKGAGIAYIGTTRATLGSPVVYLEDGELVIAKERGIAGMLTYLFEAYHSGKNTLGDITSAAIEKYVDENTFSIKPENENSFAVLMSFVLLGDPALSIPVKKIVNDAKNPSYQKPHLIPLAPDGYTNEKYSRPWYYTDTNITFQIETNSPTISIKIIDIDQDVVYEKKEMTINNSTECTFTFQPHEEHNFLLRVSSQDGKEGWLYFSTISAGNTQ